MSQPEMDKFAVQESNLGDFSRAKHVKGRIASHIQPLEPLLNLLFVGVDRLTILMGKKSSKEYGSFGFQEHVQDHNNRGK